MQLEQKKGVKSHLKTKTTNPFIQNSETVNIKTLHLVYLLLYFRFLKSSFLTITRLVRQLKHRLFYPAPFFKVQLI